MLLVIVLLAGIGLLTSGYLILGGLITLLAVFAIIREYENSDSYYDDDWED